MSDPPSHRGRLFVIAAPSGAGKTSLVRALMERVPALRFSISYTTRARRPTEEHGRDYFFVDKDEFARMVGAGEFLEHATVFDKSYGTARRQVEQSLAGGQDLILEIDWQGAQQVRRALSECVSIFILPPSRAELEVAHVASRPRCVDDPAPCSRRRWLLRICTGARRAGARGRSGSTGGEHRRTHGRALHQDPRARGGHHSPRHSSARAPAQWLADHQETSGLPAGTESYVTEMKNAARAVAATDEIGNAAVATAQAVSTCGNCHTVAKVTPKMPEVSVPAESPGNAAHRRAHQYAVDLMYSRLDRAIRGSGPDTGC